MHPPVNWRLRCLGLLALGCIVAGSGLLTAGQPAAQTEPNPEALTRGPIHEALAKPVVFDPQPGIIAPRQPPEPIEELPPDQKLEGDNVIWIAGYWYWDDTRQDFLWVSGLWRDLPPGRTWVPGYWAAVTNGYQWVAGFWATAETAEITYLPKPPPTVETGPNSEPPSPDQVWIPGTWVWQENRYLWQPGAWIAANPNWIWVPSNYLWTPSGYVFIQGYWDYVLDRRGLAFAPVVLDRRLMRADYVYTPSVVLDASLLLNYMFVWPSHVHYYFGDYYDARYLQAGVYPWFAFHNSRFGYDPLFTHAHWYYGRRDPQWVSHVREHYWHLRERQELRPPPTYTAWARITQQQGGNTHIALIAHPLKEVIHQRNFPVRLVEVDSRHRKDYRLAATETRQLIQERARWEGRKVHESAKIDDRAAREGVRNTQTGNVTKWQLPRTASAARTNTPPGRTTGAGAGTAHRPPEVPARPHQQQATEDAGRGRPNRPLPGPEEMLRQRTPEDRNRNQPPGQQRDTTGAPGRDRNQDNRPVTPPIGRDRGDERGRPPVTPPGRDRDDRGRPPTTPPGSGADRDRPPSTPPGRDRDDRGRSPVPPAGGNRTGDRPTTPPPGGGDRTGDRPTTPPPGSDRDRNRPPVPPSGADRDRDRPPVPPPGRGDQGRDRPKDTPPRGTPPKGGGPGKG